MNKEKMDLEIALMIITAMTHRSGDELLVATEDLEALETLKNKGLSIEMTDKGIELKIVDDMPKPIKSKIVIAK